MITHFDPVSRGCGDPALIAAMKARHFPSVLALIGVFVLMNPLHCAADSSQRAKTATLDDNGKSIKVAHGARLIIVLPSTPGTGYSWKVDNSAGECLKPLAQPKYVPARDAMPGEPGKEIFQFRAMKQGTGELKLDYLRPWEKNVAPAKTFSVTITVN
jgi:inhibitor of cysteine peptidase